MAELRKKEVRTERIAHILSKVKDVPRVDFGNVITMENTYAVSYIDGGGSIPEEARLKLSPHKTIGMHGDQRISYMVTLPESERDLKSELELLAQTRETHLLMIGAVHEVKNTDGQNGNGKSRIIRTIKPVQNLYYTCDSGFGVSQQNLAGFREAVIAQLSADGSHCSLHDFKHIIKLVKRGGQTQFQYSLPAELPPVFINRIENVNTSVRFGSVVAQTNFKLDAREPRVLPFRPRKAGDPKDIGIRSEYRPFVLNEQLGYLRKSIEGENCKLVHWAEPSTTCMEKYELLRKDPSFDREWSLDRIFSAHYFDGPAGYIVLVGPRLSEIDDEEGFVAKATNIRREFIRKSPILPVEMQHGTCTPFVYESTARYALNRIILLDLPESLMARKADYSIGGHGPSAHRASIQMAPKVAKDIIIQEIGAKMITGGVPGVTSMPHPLYCYAPQSPAHHMIGSVK